MKKKEVTPAQNHFNVRIRTHGVLIFIYFYWLYLLGFEHLLVYSCHPTPCASPMIDCIKTPETNFVIKK